MKLSSSNLQLNDEVKFNAIIKDKAGNSRTGTQSSTTITFDEELPGTFKVGSVVTTGEQ